VQKALLITGFGHMTGTIQLSLLDSMQLGEYSTRAKIRKTTRNINCVSHYNMKYMYTMIKTVFENNVKYFEYIYHNH